MAELRSRDRHVPARHEDPNQLQDARRRPTGLVEKPRRSIAGELLLRRGRLRQVPPGLRLERDASDLAQRAVDGRLGHRGAQPDDHQLAS